MLDPDSSTALAACAHLPGLMLFARLIFPSPAQSGWERPRLGFFLNLAPCSYPQRKLGRGLARSYATDTTSASNPANSRAKCGLASHFLRVLA
jgi:hypothetical protein